MVAALYNVTKRDMYLQSFTRWQLCCHADSNCRSVAKGGTFYLHDTRGLEADAGVDELDSPH